MEKQPEAPGFGKLKWQEEKQPKARPGRFSQERLEMKSRREEAPRMESEFFFFEFEFSPVTEELRRKLASTVASSAFPRSEGAGTAVCQGPESGSWALGCARIEISTCSI